MRKLYSLYLASNFVVPLLVSSTFFVMFLLTFEMFRVMQMLTANDISFWFIVKLMGNIGITLIPMAIPLSIFFSTIFCVNKLSSDSEYIALRSFGVQKFQILLPFILVSVLMATNLYFLNQDIVPTSYKKVRTAIKKISSESLIEGIKSGQFFTRIPNVTLFAGKVEEKSKKLEDVFLHVYNTSNNSERVIMAKSGQILYSKNEDTGIESFKLTLSNGNILTRSEKEYGEKIDFKEYLFPISEKKFSYQTKTKEVMMTKSELNSFLKDGLKKALARNYSKEEFFNAQYEFWNRMNTPLLCILLTFLGFGLGVKANRGRGKNSSGKAILILLGYYVFFFSLLSLARGESIPLSLVLVIPAIVLFGVGVYHYRHIDWQS